MRISDSEYFILNILKKALFGLNAPEIPTEDINWNDIFNDAKHHTVLPLVLQELVDSPNKYNIDDKILQRWKAAVAYQVTLNYKLMFKQDEVIRFLDNANIPYAVLKGTSVSACYPRSELRVLGDIDLLFKPSDCKKAVELLCENGYKNQNLNLTIHEVIEKDGIRVEPHYMVAEMPDNEAGKNISDFLSDAISFTESEEISPYSFKVLSIKHQAVALLLHMERHISHDGIGLRQLCDWAMFVDKKANIDLWKTEIEPLLKKCGLLKFAHAVTRTCILYLGLEPIKCSWCNEIDDKICDDLISSILRSGNMGRKSADNLMVKKLSVLNRDSVAKSSVSKNLFKNINNIAKRDFYVYYKTKLIVPFIWLYIPIRHLFRIIARKRKKQFAFNTFTAVKEQKRLYESLDLYKIE